MLIDANELLRLIELERASNSRASVKAKRDATLYDTGHHAGVETGLERAHELVQRLIREEATGIDDDEPTSFKPDTATGLRAVARR